jgi:hypothetical protein
MSMRRDQPQRGTRWVGSTSPDAVTGSSTFRATIPDPGAAAVSIVRLRSIPHERIGGQLVRSDQSCVVQQLGMLDLTVGAWRGPTAFGDGR